MTDERIIEYLRERGRSDVPIGFVSSVMTAVDEAPAARLWFGFSLPLLAGVAVAGTAIVLALAFVLGPGRPVGPAPSATPSATTSAGTLDELRTELEAATEALRASPGVRGRFVSSLRDVLGTATWFDWRANGDQVVIQRIDIDVTETGWWLDPTGSPPATGQRVTTSMHVGVGDQFLSANASAPGAFEGWQEATRLPLASFATGILSGEISPAQLLGGPGLAGPPVPNGSFARRVDADGRVTWTAETAWRGGTATQRWGIDADGTLRSLTIEIVGAAIDTETGFSGNMTSASLEFDVLADPAPITLPDVADVPDPADFGLPSDFPMSAPTATPAPTAAVTDDVTCSHPTGTYHVTLPNGWWTNATYQHPQLGELAACRFFGPASFDPASATPDEFIPDGVSLTIDFIQGGCLGFINPMLSQRELDVDGWAATATEFAQGKLETNPPSHYQVVINLLPDDPACEAGGMFIVGRTDIDMMGDYEANKVALDQVMASMEITFSEP